MTSTTLILGVLLAAAGISITAEAQEMAGMTMKPSTLSTKQKIDLALSAGPSNVAGGATVC